MVVTKILIHQGGNLVRVNPMAYELVNIRQANVIMHETDAAHRLHIAHQLK